MANITNLISNIRKAVFGKDVRESIASAIEQTYEDATASGNANMEVSEARGTFDTLNKRLNNSDSVKADKTTTDDLQNQINNMSIIEKLRIKNNRFNPFVLPEISNIDFFKQIPIYYRF